MPLRRHHDNHKRMRTPHKIDFKIKLTRAAAERELYASNAVALHAVTMELTALDSEFFSNQLLITPPLNSGINEPESLSETEQCKDQEIPEVLLCMQL